MKPHLAPLLLLLFLTACVTTGDPVTVNAERTTAIALDAFDVFTEWEFKNRDSLAQWPEIRSIADQIRANTKAWLTQARDLTKAYQASHAPEDRGRLDFYLAVLQTNAGQALTLKGQHQEIH